MEQAQNHLSENSQEFLEEQKITSIMPIYLYSFLKEKKPEIIDSQKSNRF